MSTAPASIWSTLPLTCLDIEDASWVPEYLAFVNDVDNPHYENSLYPCVDKILNIISHHYKSPARWGYHILVKPQAALRRSYTAEHFAALLDLFNQYHDVPGLLMIIQGMDDIRDNCSTLSETARKNPKEGHTKADSYNKFSTNWGIRYPDFLLSSLKRTVDPDGKPVYTQRIHVVWEIKVPKAPMVRALMQIGQDLLRLHQKSRSRNCVTLLTHGDHTWVWASAHNMLRYLSLPNDPALPRRYYIAVPSLGSVKSNTKVVFALSLEPAPWQALDFDPS